MKHMSFKVTLNSHLSTKKNWEGRFVTWSSGKIFLLYVINDARRFFVGLFITTIYVNLRLTFVVFHKSDYIKEIPTVIKFLINI